MKKIIVIIILLYLVINMVPANARADADLYAIQLGVFKSEKNAGNFVKYLKNKGIAAYKIDTSIHSVFYGIYTCENEAIQDLNSVKKVVKDAYYVKLNKKQQVIYRKEIGAGSVIVLENHDHEEAKNGSDKLTTGMKEEQKQISINKTSTGSLEYTYRVLNDIELRGIKGESKWFFNVEKGMKVEDFKLNLFIRVNELIRTDISYFTVYMNDIPIKSMRLKEAKDKLLYSWKVDIPRDLIKEGYNELKVRTHSRISDSACEDDKNIANWVIIDGNTNYVIRYDKVFSSTDISDFPKPFVGLYADDAQGIGVVIPENYTENEISAALTLIAHLKDYSFAYAVPSTLVRSNDPSIADFDSLIYIGNFENKPKELKNLIKKRTEQPADNAYIYESTLGNNHIPVFMIVSDNGERLVKAVKALNNSELKKQMTAKYIKLKPDLDTTIKENRASDYIYLSDLGMNGIKVEGTNKQVANIGIRIPTDKMLANESNITLKVRYSDNLDFEKSYVSVYVNGIPIGSQKLVREKRDLDVMTFYMPESLRRNYYYDVRIIFELIPAGIIDCKRYLKSTPWAYIQKDSNYFFPKLERKMMLLNNLPFPFSKNDDLDDTTIVIPDNPDRNDFEIAGKIAELTGIGVKNNAGIVAAITGAMFNEKYFDNNLIIFGTPEENSAIKTINKDLWFQYNKQFSTILSNEKIELLPETATTATFLELKTSPFNEDKGLMTMTSLNRESLIKASEYLGDKERGLLTGDAAIISKNGDLQTFRFQKDEDTRPVIGTGQNITRDMKEYLIFSGVLALFLIISLVLYLLKNRKNNR